MGASVCEDLCMTLKIVCMKYLGSGSDIRFLLQLRLSVVCICKCNGYFSNCTCGRFLTYVANIRYPHVIHTCTFVTLHGFGCIILTEESRV